MVHVPPFCRFCGPATRIRVHSALPSLGYASELRTEGEAVSETGRRSTGSIVVPPSIVYLLQSTPPLIYLTGPPGTGKTLTLLLMALHSLQQTYCVQVVSTCTESFAASVMILNQLRKLSSPADRQLIQLHRFDLQTEDPAVIDAAVTSLLTSAGERKICVIADEACCDSLVQR